jgi:hypothetical protein
MLALVSSASRKMADALKIDRAADLDGGREVIEREPGVERIDADDEQPRPRRLIVDRGRRGRGRRLRMSASAPQSLAHANLRSDSCGQGKS